MQEQVDRRRSQVQFEGDDRRRTYSDGEMPPYPAPGDSGADSRGHRRPSDETLGGGNKFRF